MTLKELYKKLTDSGITDSQYYLHGLYGSTDDNERLGLQIFKQNNRINYQVFFKERGQVTSAWDFNSEDEACKFMFEKLKDEQTFWRIRKIEGLGGMTVNERLFASGLLNEFDKLKKDDKNRARKILKWLQVDEPSINEIIG
jgi:hypothetical protein